MDRKIGPQALLEKGEYKNNLQLKKGMIENDMLWHGSVGFGGIGGPSVDVVRQKFRRSSEWVSEGVIFCGQMVPLKSG